MKRLLMLCLAFLALMPAAAPAQGPMPEAAPGPYRLGTGDEVRVAVFGLDAVSNSYIIGDSGTVSMPLVGPIPADGKTVAEVEVVLAAALKEKQILREPSVSVQVVKYRPFYILGEVQKPGQYAYVPGMTVLNAVSIAGGYTFRANTKKATITRNTAGTTQKGTAKPEGRVLPGDTVVIPEAWF
jgi:polysaccharide export outer membrane protein